MKALKIAYGLQVIAYTPPAVVSNLNLPAVFIGDDPTGEPVVETRTAWLAPLVL